MVLLLADTSFYYDLHLSSKSFFSLSLSFHIHSGVNASLASHFTCVQTIQDKKWLGTIQDKECLLFHVLSLETSFALQKFLMILFEWFHSEYSKFLKQIVFKS